MARRKAWDELSGPYRARLQRQGITARSHRSADLRPARGHFRGAAPVAATRAYQAGTSTAAQDRELRRWYSERAPRWIQLSVPEGEAGFAAILSRDAPGSPKGWSNITIHMVSNVVEIERKDGTVVEIALPPKETDDVRLSAISWAWDLLADSQYMLDVDVDSD